MAPSELGLFDAFFCEPMDLSQVLSGELRTRPCLPDRPSRGAPVLTRHKLRDGRSGDTELRGQRSQVFASSGQFTALANVAQGRAWVVLAIDRGSDQNRIFLDQCL